MESWQRPCQEPNHTWVSNKFITNYRSCKLKFLTVMPWKLLLIYGIVYQVNPLALEKLKFTLQYICFKQLLSQVITCLNFNINLKEKYALKNINFFLSYRKLYIILPSSKFWNSEEWTCYRLAKNMTIHATILEKRATRLLMLNHDMKSLTLLLTRSQK